MTEIDLDTFVNTRPRLFRIAYRIVGDVQEAEDIMQEVWLRWDRTDRSAVINPAAFLATTTSRLAINHIQSAHRRHETTAVPWQHEEAAGNTAEPQTETERCEEIEHTVGLLLERLPPSERAVFVLREGFGYPYSQIAETLQISQDNARQLVKRARTRIAATRSYPFSPAARTRFLKAFGSAARGGDMARLEQVLIADLARTGRRRSREAL